MSVVHSIERERCSQTILDAVMELLGLAEVAELLGSTKQNVANWRARREDFPEPVATLKSGPVWNADSILEWASNEGIAIQREEPDDAADFSRRRAIVVAMMNMKGGVGKST
jgi:chromosome partitioning protein